jgi:gas vesicle protein
MNRLMGFLAGMGAGIGLGLLFAPRSGDRTRAFIRQRAADGADYMRKRSEEFRDTAADALREGSRRMVKETEAVRAAVDAGRRAYSESRS